MIPTFHGISIPTDGAGAYLVAFAVFVGTIVVFKLLQKFVLKKIHAFAERTRTDIDDALVAMIQGIGLPFIVLLALFLALQGLVVPAFVALVVRVLFILAFVWEVVRGVERIADHILAKRFAIAEANGSEVQQTRTMISAVRIAVKIALWSFGIALALSNIGVDVTSLVAGLGIGGIAIALAVQNILADLFSSFSLFIDKPFIVGDFIVIGGDSGTVEHIGLKSTRIRTLQGEQLVVSNKELTTVRVQNFKRMAQRRVVFRIGVEYGTPIKKLRKIPEIIRGTVDDCENLKFDRCHFDTYADSSLEYETVFYVTLPDYNTYMDIKQRVFFEIYERFGKEGIAFAFPTQTVHLQREA